VEPAAPAPTTARPNTSSATVPAAMSSPAGRARRRDFAGPGRITDQRSERQLAFAARTMSGSIRLGAGTASRRAEAAQRATGTRSFVLPRSFFVSRLRTL
jgi:hypothetical protein